MNKLMPRLAIFALSVASSAGITAEATAPPSVVRLVPPRLDKDQLSLDRFYPEPQDREALVYVGFRLTAKGEVADPVIEEGGFHDKRFTDAALKIVRQLRFKPAMLDGTPVDYPDAKIPVRFSLPGSDGHGIRGVTEEFRKEAKKVGELIEKKDVAGAHFHAQWMMAEKVKLAYEFALLQATLAETHARSGNLHRALTASREVTAYTGMGFHDYEPGGPLPKVSLHDFLLPKELLGYMLQLRFNLASSLGFYLDALRAHADLQALGMVPAGDPTMATFQKLLEAVQTVPMLRARARIDEAREWNHELWFHNFSVRSVRNGSLQQIQLRCGTGNTRELVYVPDAEWNVPERWKYCDVRFIGSPGTEFDIVEFRDRAKAETRAEAAPTGPPDPEPQAAPTGR